MYHLYLESKEQNKLVTITKRKQTHVENKLVLTSGEREAGTGNIVEGD